MRIYKNTNKATGKKTMISKKLTYEAQIEKNQTET